MLLVGDVQSFEKNGECVDLKKKNVQQARLCRAILCNQVQSSPAVSRRGGVEGFLT